MPACRCFLTCCDSPGHIQRQPRGVIERQASGVRSYPAGHRAPSGHSASAAQDQRAGPGTTRPRLLCALRPHRRRPAGHAATGARCRSIASQYNHIPGHLYSPSIRDRAPRVLARPRGSCSPSMSASTVPPALPERTKPQPTAGATTRPREREETTCAFTRVHSEASECLGQPTAGPAGLSARNAVASLRYGSSCRRISAACQAAIS